MSELLPLPKFDNDLADFVGDLRAKIFASKLEAARYFKLARTTVSRYESGQLVPPLGYLAGLAQLHLERLVVDESYKHTLLQEINKVLRWYYRDKVPFQKPLHDWAELSHLAQTYLTTRQFSGITPLKTPIPPTISAPTLQEDWGEAIQTTTFYGRTSEITQLENWIITEQCRLVSIIGLGGAGKTTLATQLSLQLRLHFERVFWRSLRNAPTIDEILADCLSFLVGPEMRQLPLPASLNERLALLLKYLRQQRCLIVLDNFEAILQAGQPESSYHSEHRGYGELLRRIAGIEHRSCVILTSREKPTELNLWENNKSLVHTLALQGLETQAAQQLLAEVELSGSTADFQQLAQTYTGNPLALKLVASTIHELFGGSVTNFLAEGQAIFGGISRLLDQQFERLSSIEQMVMYWLGIEREPGKLAELETDLFPTERKQNLWEALAALKARSLIEVGPSNFTQQPVVMEYITERLVAQLSHELLQNHFELLTRYALLKASAKDYVRAAQVRMLVKPILQNLLTQWGSAAALEQYLRTKLDSLRLVPRFAQGYAGGNLANLLYQLQGNLRGYNFSQLNIWQLALQGIELQDSDFSFADLNQATFTETFDIICAVAFSPDGQLLAAGSSNGEVRLWRIADGKTLFTASSHGGAVHALAFNSSGSLLASGGTDHKLRLWDIPTRASNASRLHCLQTLEGHTNWIWSLAFNPSGNLLASSSGDQTVRLWDTNSWQCLQILEGHTNPVRSIAFSPDNKWLASGSGDQTVRLWDTNSWQCLQILEGHQGWVQTVAFSPHSNLLASAGEDNTIKIWDITLETSACIQTLSGHTDWIWSLAFNNKGSWLASASSDRLVKIWNCEDWQCLATLDGHTGPVRAVSWQPNGAYLASGSGDRTIKLWEAATWRCFKTWQGYSHAVRSLALSPNGQFLASCSSDRLVQLWDITLGHVVKNLPSNGELFWSVAFNADGSFLAGGSDEKNITLWDVASASLWRKWQAHTAWVQQVAFSPDGRHLLSGSGDHTIKIWDTTGQACQILSKHRDWVWTVAYSPDGKLAASGSEDSTICLWDTQTGTCLKSLTSESAWILALAFSPDGTKLAACSGADHSITIWDVASGTSLAVWHGHTGSIWTITFSPDGELVASGSGDGTIKLWEVSSNACVATLTGHTGWIRSLVFRQGNNNMETLLISGSEDGTIRLWEMQHYQCQTVLYSAKPYEGMKIKGVSGLSQAQKDTLLALGALE
jgi:WD40 repeat protein